MLIRNFSISLSSYIIRKHPPIAHLSTMPWDIKNKLKQLSGSSSSTSGSSISAPTSVTKHTNGMHQLTQTSYTSKEVEIPSDFLRTQPQDAHPITVQRVKFAETPLPEYEPCYATVIDNALSASECENILLLAEMSSPTGGWAPAMVNAGMGYELLATDIRHCDR